VCVSAIIADGSAPRWFAVIVVCREALLGVVLVVLYLAGMKRFDVTWWGKTGTFLLMFAFPGFLLGASTIGIHTLFQIAAWIMGLPGLAISLYAAVTYVPMMRTALVEGRAERRNPKG
jgi:cardiolipin synthase